MSATSYGQVPPNFIRTEADRIKAIDSMASVGTTSPRIDRNSNTWKAVKQHIAEIVSTEYMPTLRNRSMDHGQNQYAKGAMDALDSLLNFGGEEV